jgi:ribosomal protein L3 glutamine methyltransferase
MSSNLSLTLRTLRDVLRYSTSRFCQAKLVFGHGTQNAYDEAAYLLLYGLHLPPDTLEPFLDARLLPEEIKLLLSLIERRIDERIPAAYITQEAWLHGFRFYIDQRAIIPRSPIGELLQEKLSPWVETQESIGRILELCTGSACLAIMAAMAFPKAHIDALDISADALAVAKRNCSDYQLEARIHLLESNLYQALPADASYDLIIANPPYVCAASMDALSFEHRAEPRLALDGGANGMDVIRRILASAAEYLTPKGMLILEIGHEAQNFLQEFPHLSFIWLPTSAGDEQVLLVHAQDL